LRFDQRILLLAPRRRLAGRPSFALILLWTGDYTPKVQWTLTVFIVGVVGSTCSFSVRHRVVLPLQTAVEPAGGAARERLLHPRARRARAATTRSAR